MEKITFVSSMGCIYSGNKLLKHILYLLARRRNPPDILTFSFICPLRAWGGCAVAFWWLGSVSKGALVPSRGPG